MVTAVTTFSPEVDAQTAGNHSATVACALGRTTNVSEAQLKAVTAAIGRTSALMMIFAIMLSSLRDNIRTINDAGVAYALIAGLTNHALPAKAFKISYVIVKI